MNPTAPARPATLRTEHRAGPMEWTVAALVGGLLIFAAGAKLFASEGGVNSLGVGAFALAAVEVGIAVGLLIFRTRWWAWAGVATLFGAFAGYAGFRAYWGSASCGCFGSLSLAPHVTMTLDIGVALLAMFMAARRSPSMSPTGLVATAAGIAAVLGSGVGMAIADPRPQDFGDDATRLLLSLRPINVQNDPIAATRARMPEVASTRAGEPAWYLYIFNPDCPICMRHLPRMRALESQWADNDVLRVAVISMAELEEYAGIPAYAWGTPPLTLLVQRGIVTRRASGENMLDPEAIRAELADLPDPFTALTALPEVAGAVEASATGPAQLIYLYTNTCGECREHLAKMDAFTADRPDDPLLRIQSFSHAELTSRGVDSVHWPELRNAYLVRNGELVQTYSANEIPDPLTLLVELASGTAGLPQ